jgi:PAS domain S-box-containing protein
MATQKDRNKSRIFSDLRSKAELLIKDKSASPQHFSIEEFDKLLHELEVHQIELEKQNEKLNLAHLKAEDSRNRYLDLYDFSPNGYFTVDQNGLIYDVNLAGSDMLGVERRLLKKKRLSSFIVPDCQDAYYLYCNQILETGARQSCVLQLRKNDGTVIWGLLDSIVIPGSDVNSVHLRTTLADITSQKESEFTLGETEEFYRIILSNISDAVFITDYKGAFIFICPNAAVIFGYNPAEIKIFNNISKLLGNDLFDHHELKQQGEIRNINCRIIDKYGKHHNLLINVKQVHIKGETLLYTCRDATLLINANKELNKHQKHLEEIVETRTDELNTANKQLKVEINERKKTQINLEKLNAQLMVEYNQRKALSQQLITTLERDRQKVAVALHDHISQNLIVLKREIERTLLKENLMVDVLEHTLCKTTEKLVATIQNIREISTELRPSMLTTLGLIPSLRALIDELRESTDLKTTFFHRNVPLKIGDEKELAVYRIIQEALMNVVKHSRAETVHIKVYRSKNLLKVSVHDNGANFNKSLINKVSEKNSGLGLLIMRERALQVSGTFSIEFIPGQGTHLALEVPL